MIARLKRSGPWLVAAALCALFVLYWGMFAADRYVSESHIVVDSLQAPPAPRLDLASLVSGGGGGGGGPKDILLLQDYLMSVDMLKKLDDQLNLREHYSASYDVFSRLWAKDISPEWFQQYYRSRVSASYDDYSGVLAIRAQAYTPEMAQSIQRGLLEEGERFMNEAAHKLAREQVAFAESEVTRSAGRVQEARQALLAYQNEHDLVSPRAQVETVSGTVARLEGELSSVEARKRMLQTYLAPKAPELVQATAQARALEDQLASERARLTSSREGKPLNKVNDEYEALLLKAEFALDVYKTALAALERARADASRTLKKVSVLQAPTLPVYALEPRRFYNIVVYVLATLLLTSIAQLLLVIVREHRD
jgi:capsular polysaccharide transport system permease protein